jgi:hypothetical protein
MSATKTTAATNGTPATSPRATGEPFSAIEEGQKSALGAVRTFIDTVDDALPGHGEDHSRAERIVDAALEMSQRLVHAQYEFLRNVTRADQRGADTRER